MEEILNASILEYQVFGQTIYFKPVTLVMTLIVIAILIFFGFLSTKKIGVMPNPLQVIGELIVTAFYDLTVDALGTKKAPKYFPLICTLFLFMLLSNWIGVIPKLSEPTQDLNTPLSLGILGFVIAHYSGIRAKGIKVYLKGYMEPIFLLAPLNVIGELSKVISISFRLFGNILGGAIIIAVVTSLIKGLLLPPGLLCFFGLFVGTIQAFVFTMLTLVYISVQVN